MSSFSHLPVHTGVVVAIVQYLHHFVFVSPCLTLVFAMVPLDITWSTILESNNISYPLSPLEPSSSLILRPFLGSHHPLQPPSLSPNPPCSPLSRLASFIHSLPLDLTELSLRCHLFSRSLLFSICFEWTRGQIPAQNT